MRVRAVLTALAVLLAACVGAAAAQTQAVVVDLTQSLVTLNGPWMFRVGDDPQWASPGFDDSAWEHVDLSAPASATDGDVGLPHYAPGWSAKGHPGYGGFAWYRIHLIVHPPAGAALALLGPWAVESAYQVYANGKLLGGVGDFSGATPIAYGYHYPTLFPLPPSGSGSDSLVVAIRVWLGPWAVGAPTSGGIHIAPAIGERDAIAAQYHLQWLKIFEGYVVDAAPALLFFLAALMVLCVRPFERRDPTYLWLTVALVLSGVQRGNQAFFFWWRIETIQDFVIFILVLAGSLSLGAWMMAWRSWFNVESPAWLPKLVAALTLALLVAQLLAYPWVIHTTLPHTVRVVLRDLISALRWSFLAVLVVIVFLGIRRQGREGWYALPAILAIGAVLFTGQLTALHVPGIWFPWGVGVSLSEYASVAFVLLLSALLLRRLWSHAQPVQPT